MNLLPFSATEGPALFLKSLTIYARSSNDCTWPLSWNDAKPWHMVSRGTDRMMKSSISFCLVIMMLGSWVVVTKNANCVSCSLAMSFVGWCCLHQCNAMQQRVVLCHHCHAGGGSCKTNTAFWGWGVFLLYQDATARSIVFTATQVLFQSRHLYILGALCWYNE